MLLRALPEELPRLLRPGSSPHQRSPGSGAARNTSSGIRQRLFELWRLWNAKIQEINPNASYLANAGGGALSELDMKTVGELAPTLLRTGKAGRARRPLGRGKSAKEFRSTMGRKAIAGIFSVGLEDKYRWKDSVQSGDEIRLWVADGMAQDFRPTFTKFNAKPYRQALVSGRGRDLQVALRKRGLFPQRKVPCARGHGLLAANRLRFMADRMRPPRWKIPGSAFTRRWSKRESRSKWCTIVCSIVSSRASFAR